MIQQNILGPLIRFYSCGFKNEKSKNSTARVVLSKECNIVNCYTIESSFHSFFNKDRETIELNIEFFEKFVNFK